MDTTLLSSMEERAALYPTLPGENHRIPVIAPSGEEIAIEISCLRREIKRLSQELRRERSALRKKEAYFVTLTNYKHSLQRKITPIKKVTLKDKDKDKEKTPEDVLLEKLEKMTPEELEAMGQIELGVDYSR